MTLKLLFHVNESIKSVSQKFKNLFLEIFFRYLKTLLTSLLVGFKSLTGKNFIKIG